MKTTNKYAVISVIVSAVITGLFAAFIPGLSFWVYAIFFAIVAAGIYQGAIKQKALENVANLGSENKK